MAKILAIDIKPLEALPGFPKWTANCKRDRKTVVTWHPQINCNFPPRKNVGCANASHDFPQRKYNIFLSPTGGHLIPFPHPQRVYGRTEYADIITIFSRMGIISKFSYRWCSAACTLRARKLCSAFLSWIIEVTAKKDLQVSIEILPFLTGTNFIQHCIMTTPSCT